jgi:hypothetical protein
MLWVMGYLLWVVGYGLSVIGCRLSVVGYRLSDSEDNYVNILTFFTFEPITIDDWLTTILITHN